MLAPCNTGSFCHRRLNRQWEPTGVTHTAAPQTQPSKCGISHSEAAPHGLIGSRGAPNTSAAHRKTWHAHLVPSLDQTTWEQRSGTVTMARVAEVCICWKLGAPRADYPRHATYIGCGGFNPGGPDAWSSSQLLLGPFGEWPQRMGTLPRPSALKSRGKSVVAAAVALDEQPFARVLPGQLVPLMTHEGAPRLRCAGAAARSAPRAVRCRAAAAHSTPPPATPTRPATRPQPRDQASREHLGRFQTIKLGPPNSGCARSGPDWWCWRSAQWGWRGRAAAAPAPSCIAPSISTGR